MVYRHFFGRLEIISPPFLADFHTGMQCTKFGQLIVRKSLKFLHPDAFRFLGAKCAKMRLPPDPVGVGGAYSAPPDSLAGFKGAYTSKWGRAG